MTTYTVYHLIGRKFGCTQNLPKRIKRYPRHQTKLLLKVVTELDDAREASRLEWRLNRLAGYPKQHPRYEHTVRIAPLGGQKLVELGVGIHQQTSEEKAELGRQGGLKGGRTTRERGVGIFGLSQEQKAANGRKAGRRAAEVIGPERLAEKGRKMGQMRGMCPQCGTITNAGNLKQWHGDNCRQKIRQPLRRPA